MEAIREALDDLREWWSERPQAVRWSLIGAGAGIPAGIVIVAVLLLVSGGGDSPELAATPPPGTATTTPTSSPTPTPTPLVGSVRAASQPELDDPMYGVGPIPAAAEEGPPTIGSLSELTELYGEAPDATLGRFRIPVLGIDAPIGTRYVTDSTMPAPTGPGDVVWYDLSQWQGLGGNPGRGGNAIYSGHVDYFAPVAWADAIYRGRGVFYNLDLLSPGDVIEVEVGGNVYRYSVVWREQVSAGPDGDWNSILSGNVAVDSLTLITCGGDFDINERSYNNRIVVRAERV